MSPLDPILNSGLQDSEFDAAANGTEADWGPMFIGGSFVLFVES